MLLMPNVVLTNRRSGYRWVTKMRCPPRTRVEQQVSFQESITQRIIDQERQRELYKITSVLGHAG